MSEFESESIASENPGGEDESSLFGDGTSDDLFDEAEWDMRDTTPQEAELPEGALGDDSDLHVNEEEIDDISTDPKQDEILLDQKREVEEGQQVDVDEQLSTEQPAERDQLSEKDNDVEEETIHNSQNGDEVPRPDINQRPDEVQEPDEVRQPVDNQHLDGMQHSDEHQALDEGGVPSEGQLSEEESPLEDGVAPADNDLFGDEQTLQNEELLDDIPQEAGEGLITEREKEADDMSDDKGVATPRDDENEAENVNEEDQADPNPDRNLLSPLGSPISRLRGASYNIDSTTEIPGLVVYDTASVHEKPDLSASDVEDLDPPITETGREIDTSQAYSSRNYLSPTTDDNIMSEHIPVIYQIEGSSPAAVAGGPVPPPSSPVSVNTEAIVTTAEKATAMSGIEDTSSTVSNAGTSQLSPENDFESPEAKNEESPGLPDDHDEPRYSEGLPHDTDVSISIPEPEHVNDTPYADGTTLTALDAESTDLSDKDYTALGSVHTEDAHDLPLTSDNQPNKLTAEPRDASDTRAGVSAVADTESLIYYSHVMDDSISENNDITSRSPNKDNRFSSEPPLASGAVDSGSPADSLENAPPQAPLPPDLESDGFESEPPVDEEERKISPELQLSSGPASVIVDSEPPATGDEGEEFALPYSSLPSSSGRFPLWGSYWLKPIPENTQVESFESSDETEDTGDTGDLDEPDDSAMIDSDSDSGSEPGSSLERSSAPSPDAMDVETPSSASSLGEKIEWYFNLKREDIEIATKAASKARSAVDVAQKLADELQNEVLLKSEHNVPTAWAVQNLHGAIQLAEAAIETLQIAQESVPREYDMHLHPYAEEDLELIQHQRNDWKILGDLVAQILNDIRPIHALALERINAAGVELGQMRRIIETPEVTENIKDNDEEATEEGRKGDMLAERAEPVKPEYREEPVIKDTPLLRKRKFSNQSYEKRIGVDGQEITILRTPKRHRTIRRSTGTPNIMYDMYEYK
ncbi:hypothetical protein F5Y16DRAFT_422259 [Xylariaceae sp. FL0255]|nr:hypothetical protein F5Y16DRAFT_422259 [Xylariaceae sp. FL0255]